MEKSSTNSIEKIFEVHFQNSIMVFAVAISIDTLADWKPHSQLDFAPCAKAIWWEK